MVSYGHVYLQHPCIAVLPWCGLTISRGDSEKSVSLIYPESPVTEELKESLL